MVEDDAVSERAQRSDVGRRTVLKGLGTAALAVGTTGVAAGRPGNGRARQARSGNGPADGSGGQQCSCDEGETYLAKYEVDGGFDFEADRAYDGLDVDEDAVRFCNVRTKEGERNEVIGFEWDAAPYRVTEVCVKFGPHLATFEADGSGGCGTDDGGSVRAPCPDCAGDTSGTVDLAAYYEDHPDLERPIKAVSNVVFCKDVYWQVDLIVGDIREVPRYGEQLVLASTSHPFCEEPDNPRNDRRADFESLLDVDEGAFTLDDGQDSETASIGVELLDDATVSLVSYEMPSPYGCHDLDEQVRYDHETVTTAGEHDLSVRLPTA